MFVILRLELKKASFFFVKSGKKAAWNLSSSRCVRISLNKFNTWAMTPGGSQTDSNSEEGHSSYYLSSTVHTYFIDRGKEVNLELDRLPQLASSAIEGQAGAQGYVHPSKHISATSRGWTLKSLSTTTWEIYRVSRSGGTYFDHGRPSAWCNIICL